MPVGLIERELTVVKNMEFTATEYEELLKGALMRIAELKLRLDELEANALREQQMSRDQMRFSEKQESDLREKFEKRIAELNLKIFTLTEENAALKKGAKSGTPTSEDTKEAAVKARTTVSLKTGKTPS